jgi:hypothetical protein
MPLSFPSTDTSEVAASTEVGSETSPTPGPALEPFTMSQVSDTAIETSPRMNNGDVLLIGITPVFVILLAIMARYFWVHQFRR